MNLLKEFWNWFIAPKEDACCDVSHDATPVEVEEVSESCGELFTIVCLEAGIPQRVIDKGQIAALFEDWYVGSCTRAAIAASIDSFRAAYPAVNAKLNNGKF